MKTIEIKHLITHLDDRGFLFEVLRANEGICNDVIKQVTVSTIFPGVVKAFHKHKKQIDWVCCVKGNVKLVLSDEKDFETFYLGESNPILVKIPMDVWHGYKAIGSEIATIVYCTSKTYDETDELRAAWDVFGEEIWESEFK